MKLFPDDFIMTLKAPRFIQPGIYIHRLHEGKIGMKKVKAGYKAEQSALFCHD
jgi:hypothetical protein